jgi:energy-coupling factor transporter ATP-binding protein EcfA2
MIKEVVLRRFKRFEEERFPLGGNIVLAGQNNSGKTTVLQAISAWALAFEQWKLLHDPSKHGGYYAKKPVARQAFSAVPLRAFDLLWHDRNTSGPIEIEVQAEEGWTLAMELTADSTEQIYVRPRRDTRPEQVLGPGLGVVYVSSVDGLEIEEPALGNPEWIRTLLGRQRPGSILRNLVLEVSRGNRWADLRESVRRLFGVDLLVPETPGGQILCEFRRPGQSFALDVLSAGSGFHQVLLLLACLHTRAGSVLLIDEPDAHLHLFLQDTIFSELRSVAAAQHSQIILATHSEVIFRSVPPEQLVVMMGPPRRLSSVAEREHLAKAMASLEQADIVRALDASGVLYLENFTDLNLLRAWARVLNHPTRAYFDREPFWKPIVWEPREEARGIKADDHFKALKLIREDLTGVRLVDADGKSRGVGLTDAPTRSVLNRVAWKRYETESYLVHPAALVRFVASRGIDNAADAVRAFFLGRLTEGLASAFYETPNAPPELVGTWLEQKKARTEIVGALLEECGIHGMSHTNFDEIASMMLPDEIHPEILEKLDFIQQAFGL